MSGHIRKLHHDINVPLSSTLSSSKRKQQAHLYQTRLHQLGYNGIAFCHTAYGRMNVDRDGADVALPWKDLMAFTSPPPSKKNDGNSNPLISGRDEISFGQTNSLGMKIYRRLNIIVEEVSDVSRILLTPNSTDTTAASNNSKKESSSPSAITKLFQKYDIISLQPMNEPALQNICELLSSSASSSDSGAGGPSIPNNNAHYIDIIAMEYATGSRGGYGLPYKLRKDYVMKTLQGGVTFELCYATAILDPKRRQGFLRTLMDFQTNFNGIQKKHMLLNKQLRQNNPKCKSDKFPLLLSSGSRQNYTLGTDEGALALRAPNDVKSLVCHLVGDNGWFDKGGDDGFDGDSEDGGTINKNSKRRKKSQVVNILSAAEKILARASDRSLGVVTVNQQGSSMQGKRKRGVSEIQSVVAGTSNETRDKRGIDDDKDEEDASNNTTSLIRWLSESMPKTQRNEDMNDSLTGVNTESQNSSAKETTSVSSPNKQNKHESLSTKCTSKMPEEKGDQDSQDGEDDADDGFIAL